MCVYLCKRCICLLADLNAYVHTDIILCGNMYARMFACEITNRLAIKTSTIYMFQMTIPPKNSIDSKSNFLNGLLRKSIRLLRKSIRPTPRSSECPHSQGRLNRLLRSILGRMTSTLGLPIMNRLSH